MGKVTELLAFDVNITYVIEKAIIWVSDDFTL